MYMTQTVDEIFEQICKIIAPFNKKNIPITKDNLFSVDLELDSLNVMDILSEIEDEFDITVPLNMLPDLETVGQFAETVKQLLSEQ